MRVLIIKTSSLGDIVHTLPALTDAAQAIPTISFDWVVEEAFQEVPAWHPRVKNVIPVALRRWKTHLWTALLSSEFREFIKQIRTQPYDAIIDAQGLLKSSLITYLARGQRIGLNWKSLTEPLAVWAYQKTVDVDLHQHAIVRMRSIFSKALEYPLPLTAPQIGINLSHFKVYTSAPPYFVFLHGTSWPSKHWPDDHWLELSRLIGQKGYRILVPWSNDQEYQRALKWVQANPTAIQIIPRCNLTEMASIILGATAVITVDTGLGHLAAALDIPTIGLLGPTYLKRTGIIGSQAQSLVSPFECVECDKSICRQKGRQKDQYSSSCMEQITPEMVWKAYELRH